jgi:hypothetical protein
VGLTLHNILVEVPLCIGAAMGLATDCQPGGTCCRCCPMFAGVVASTTAMVSSGAVEAAVVDVAVAKALALKVHALVGEGFLLLAAALLGLPFLVRSAAT